MSAITINAEQELFVIPCGNGYSCRGFDNVLHEAQAIARHLGRNIVGHLYEVSPSERGTIKQFDQYQALLGVVAKRGGINSTWFHKKTPAPVRQILEQYRNCGKRVRIYYGEATTGLDWLEEYETLGYVGRSTGLLKVPLLIKRRNSTGGGAILDHCIVKMQDVASKRVLWQHPTYHLPDFAVQADDDHYVVVANGATHARFPTETKANNYIAFLSGQRMRA